MKALTGANRRYFHSRRHIKLRIISANINIREKNSLTTEQRGDTEDRNWQRQRTNAGSFRESDLCWHHLLWLGVKLQIDMSSSRDVMFALVTNRNIMPPPSPLWKWRSDTGLIDLELDTIPLCHTPVPWSPVIVDNCTTHAHTHAQHFRIIALDSIDYMQG